MADFMKVLPAVSAVFQTVAPIAGGVMQRRESEAEARQYETAAGQSRAAGQRDAAEQRRQARLVQSRAQAVAGGGASDIGVINQMADIAAEGEYRALAALYEGEDRAAGLEGQAAARRYGGRMAQASGFLAGSSAFLEQSPKMFEKYGSGGYGFKRSGYGGRY